MAKKKNKKVLNIVSIIIGIISLILMLVFSYAIYKLNMIPFNIRYIYRFTINSIFAKG